MQNSNSDNCSARGTVEESGAPERVFCSICRHEIPLSEAVVPEAIDYLIYFCGLECYERWRAQANGY
jgi:Domain of unknown function (DUF3330)